MSLNIAVEMLKPDIAVFPEGFNLSTPDVLGVLYQNDMTAQLKTFLPLTYLSFGHIAGYPGAFPSLDILPFEGASFQTGVAVLLVSAAVVVAIALGASHLVSAYRAHRRVNYDA